MTMRVLVAFASKHRSTQGIAERIGARLGQRGSQVDVRATEDAGELTAYDAFVVGSGVYYGKWMKEAAGFVEHNVGVLSGHPVWLFSVGPLGDQPKPAPQRLAGEGAIKVRDHHVFYGALDVQHLSIAERLITKGVRAPRGDFRDWAEIDGWADRIADTLSAERAEVGSPLRVE